MKKIIPIVIIACLLLFVVFFMSECCLNFEITSTEEGYSFGYNNFSGKGFMGAYCWDGNLDNTTITIPDKYEKYSITTLGGAIGRGVPCPFYIQLPDEYCNEGVTEENPKETSDWYPYGYEVVEMTFTLNLGKEVTDLNMIDNPYYMYENDDGSYTLYHPVYYINCSSDNRKFYSDNGKLYYKKNDKLVTEFDYPKEIE